MSEIRAVTLDGTDLGPVEPLIVHAEPDVESFPAKLDAARREFWREDAPVSEELPWE